MQYQSLKKYTPVIIVATILVLINVFALVWYMVPAGPDQWKDDIVPGKVLAVTETSLVTADPRGNTKTFILTDTTKFFAGRKEITRDALTKETIVLVQFDTASTTDMVAKEVRVMTDKRKGKQTP